MSERVWDRDTLPEGAEKEHAVREMFDAIAQRYDLVNRIMTFRLDVRWRRASVRALALSAGSTVIDLAAGTGDLCTDLRRAGLQPIAFDFSFGMLAADRSASPRVQADILRLPLPDHLVDGATCGFALHNLRPVATACHVASTAALTIRYRGRFGDVIDASNSRCGLAPRRRGGSCLMAGKTLGSGIPFADCPDQRVIRRTHRKFKASRFGTG